MYAEFEYVFELDNLDFEFDMFCEEEDFDPEHHYVTIRCTDELKAAVEEFLKKDFEQNWRLALRMTLEENERPVFFALNEFEIYNTEDEIAKAETLPDVLTIVETQDGLNVFAECPDILVGDGVLMNDYGIRALYIAFHHLKAEYPEIDYNGYIQCFSQDMHSGEFYQYLFDSDAIEEFDSDDDDSTVFPTGVLMSLDESDIPDDLLELVKNGG